MQRWHISIVYKILSPDRPLVHVQNIYRQNLLHIYYQYKFNHLQLNMFFYKHVEININNNHKRYQYLSTVGASKETSILMLQLYYGVYCIKWALSYHMSIFFHILCWWHSWCFEVQVHIQHSFVCFFLFFLFSFFRFFITLYLRKCYLHFMLISWTILLKIL